MATPATRGSSMATKKDDGFSEAEKKAMKERATELKAAK